jgi:UTP--glucose-1-phosphate uridylyltransferase
VRIQKAVITAAGPTQRSLPLQTLVDRNGEEKSALAIILDEAQSAGIEDVCVIVHAGDTAAYSAALATSALRITYTEQDAPRGYGHALFCAREFVGDDPFLHFVSDHLYVGHGEETCAQTLVAVAEKESAAVSAVQSTRESMLPYYGAVGGRRAPHRKDLYTVQNVVEKPTPTQAEQELLVPGLRSGHYLCMFGMHALTPTVMELLAHDVERGDGAPTDLSGALTQLATKERYLAFEAPGHRYNIGVKYGLLNAQLALALHGVDREEVLTQLVELLAARESITNTD